MTLLINLSAELAGLAMTPGAVLLTVLVLRKPHNPAWMKSEMACQAASLLIVVLISGALAWALTTMTNEGIHVGIAALIAVTTITASGSLLWFAFGIGERLKRADAGFSPFGQILARSTLTPRSKAKTRIASIRSWPVHGKTHP